MAFAIKKVKVTSYAFLSGYAFTTTFFRFTLGSKFLIAILISFSKELVVINDIFSNKIANNDIYYWKRWQEYGETVNIQNKKKIILDNGIIVYEINNLGKKNGQIKNGVFLPIKYGMHYGHLIIDFIGGYFQLKKIFPDLKIIFILIFFLII